MRGSGQYSTFTDCHLLAVFALINFFTEHTEVKFCSKNLHHWVLFGLRHNTKTNVLNWVCQPPMIMMMTPPDVKGLARDVLVMRVPAHWSLNTLGILRCCALEDIWHVLTGSWCVDCSVNCLAGVFLIQAWIMWNFITFHLHRARERATADVPVINKKLNSPASPQRKKKRGLSLLVDSWIANSSTVKSSVTITADKAVWDRCNTSSATELRVLVSGKRWRAVNSYSRNEAD